MRIQMQSGTRLGMLLSESGKNGGMQLSPSLAAFSDVYRWRVRIESRTEATVTLGSSHLAATVI